MADDPKLVVGLEARLTEFEKNLRDAGLIAADAIVKIEKQLGGLGGALSGVLAGLVGGGVGALANHLLDVIQPTKLLTDAVAFLGRQIAESFAKGTPEVRELDAILKDHSATVRALRDAYGEVGKALKDFTGESVEVLRARQGAILIELQQNLDRLAQSVVNATTRVVPSLAEIEMGITELGQTIETRAERFRPFLNALTELRAGVDRGAPNIAAFRQEVARIGEESASPQIKLLAAELLRLSDEAARVDGAMKSARDAINGVALAAGAASAQTAQFAAALKSLEGIAPPQLDDRARAARAYSEALSAAGTNLGAIRAAEAAYGAALQRITEQENAAAAARGSDTNALTRYDDQLNKHILLLEAERSTIGANAAQREFARQVALAVAAAERDGLDIEEALNVERLKAIAIAADLVGANVKIEASVRQLNEVSREFGSTLGQAFKDLVLEGKKLDEVVASLVKRLASRSIDRLFDMFFAAPAGGGASPFASLLQGLFSGRAGGGPVTANRPYLVGERGPELMVPGRSGMVMPNWALARASSGNPTINYSPVIDARGTDAGTIARLQEALAADRRSFASRVVTTITEAKRRSVRL